MIFTSCSQSELDNQVYNTLTTKPQEGANYSFYTDSNLFNRLKTHRNSFPSDAFAIKEVSVIKDKLNVVVSYIGGCKPHDFEIVWDGVVNLSQKGKVYLYIKHKAHGDTCKVALKEKLEIDMKKYFNNLTEIDNTIVSISNTSMIQDMVSEGKILHK